MRGGVGARMDVLDIERADGRRRKVTLRRFPRDNRSSQPEHVAREYHALQLVEKAGIPAPRPLLLDAEAELFGVPAIVLTYLPGAPVYLPRDVGAWADQLARVLLAIHAVTSDRFDLSVLNVHLRDDVRQELKTRRPHAQEHGSLARSVHAVLVRDIDHIGWQNATLVHNDFWPGNTVWYRGKLTGVVDWTQAKVGDPRTDVSQCRIDLAVILDLAAAEAFREAYESNAAAPVPDIWYFDLLRGLGALLSYEFWLPGYHDAGLAHVTKRRARTRIEAFLRTALEERKTALRAMPRRKAKRLQ